MPLPRALGRFNRRATNRLLYPLLARLPGFGEVVHIGRRTGRTYRTPVLGFRRGRFLTFALTYGPETDWVRNVCAAGHARFETRTSSLSLVEPRVVQDPARRLTPAPVRPILRLLRAADFLVMRFESQTYT